MDQLSAHLDRGWDLAQRGDARGAETSARRAIDCSPDSPEAHNLLGFVVAMDGDCDEALDAYRQAILLDETYVEAMLNAAELLVHPMEHFDEALDMCDQVLNTTEYDDEILDASLLKFEAMVGQGQEKDARKLLGQLPEGPYQNPVHNHLAGRAHYECGNVERASTLLMACLEQDPNNADAHYYTGLVHEDNSDPRAAATSFLVARQLELEMGMPDWAPSPDDFLTATQKAVDELDEPLRAFINHGELFIADLPGPEVVVDGVDLRTEVLVDAVLPDNPLVFTTDSHEPEEDPSQPDLSESVQVRVFLYAINVLRSSAGGEELQSCIRSALELELVAALTELAEDMNDSPEDDLPPADEPDEDPPASSERPHPTTET